MGRGFGLGRECALADGVDLGGRRIIKKILEEGIFTELMEKKGYFYSLFTMEQ